MTGMIYNILKNPKELKPHKTNVDIYGTEPVDADLVESIKNKGILEPLVIVDDNVILSGHRRWLAAKELKLERVPCRSMSFSDELDEKEALIEFNRQRNKTYSQLMNEADVLDDIETARNKAKQLSTLKQGNTKPVPLISAERANELAVMHAAERKAKQSDNETREIVSKKIGISRDKYIKSKKVWDSAKTGDTYAKSLVEKLDKKEVTVNEAANRVKVFTEAPEPIKEKIIKEELSAKEAVAVVKKEEKKKRIEDRQIEIKKELSQPQIIKDKKYNVILADPPWKYDFSNTKNREIENQYPTMELSDICDVSVPSDENAILFLWATMPKLKEALQVMRSWGFEYKTGAVWDKRKMGMGYYFRGQHELLLVGVKGSFSPPPPELRKSSVISTVRTGHSEKPECVYNLIEHMYPHGVYLEMFARDTKTGWGVWGNEVE